MCFFVLCVCVQAKGEDYSHLSSGEPEDPTLPALDGSNSNSSGLESAMGLGLNELAELMEAAEEERALHVRMVQQRAAEEGAQSSRTTALLEQLAEAEARVSQLERENKVLNIENQVAIRALDTANPAIAINPSGGGGSVGVGGHGSVSMSGGVNASMSERRRGGGGGAGGGGRGGSRGNVSFSSSSHQLDRSREYIGGARERQAQAEREAIVEAEVERQLGRILSQFAANGVELPLRKVGQGTTYRLEGSGGVGPR